MNVAQSISPNWRLLKIASTELIFFAADSCRKKLLANKQNSQILEDSSNYLKFFILNKITLQLEEALIGEWLLLALLILLSLSEKRKWCLFCGSEVVSGIYIEYTIYVEI